MSTPKLRHRRLRSNPLTGSPTILYPAAGTRSISMRPSAPTNNISTSGIRRRNALAIDSAGKMWPPVPPPLISTFIGRCVCYRNSTGLLARSSSGSALSSSFICCDVPFCTAVRLTLSIMPNAIDVMRIEVPPLDMSGNGCPDTGKVPVVIAIWKRACNTIITASPISRITGNARWHRCAIIPARASSVR